MLKITQENSADESVTLRLEGQVIGPWVAALRESCERITARKRRLKVQLGGVDFVDRDGVDLLRLLAGRGTELVDGSPFIRAQLGDGKEIR
jgi:hypothetical protein